MLEQQAFDHDTFMNFVENLNTMTSDEIHDYCLTNGIRAVKSDSTYCAIAELINQSFVMPYDRASVGNATIHYGPLEKRTVLDLSENLQEFIRRFDMGKYPDLIDKDKTREEFKGQPWLATFVHYDTKTGFPAKGELQFADGTCIPVSGISFAFEEMKESLDIADKHLTSLAEAVAKGKK